MTIQEIYRETDGLKELKSHIFAFLEAYAVKQVMDRLDTRGVADAKDILDEAFNDLEEKFARKEQLPYVETSSR